MKLNSHQLEKNKEYTIIESEYSTWRHCIGCSGLVKRKYENSRNDSGLMFCGGRNCRQLGGSLSRDGKSGTRCFDVSSPVGAGMMYKSSLEEITGILEVSDEI